MKEVLILAMVMINMTMMIIMPMACSWLGEGIILEIVMRYLNYSRR